MPIRRRRVRRIGLLTDTLKVGALVALAMSLAMAAGRADEAAGSSAAARAAYAAAAALQNREAWDLAAEAWAALVAEHPTDPLALKGRYYLGVCQFSNGDWPAAQRTFRDVTASRADAATVALARWELGRGGFQAAQRNSTPGAFQEAAAGLRDFIDASPGHPQVPDAIFFLGESLWQSGKRDAALETWQRFVRDHAASPRMPDVLYALGVGQAELKRSADAAATFKRFAESFPTHALAADVAIWRADVATASGADVEAERLLTPLASGQGPRAADALERLAAVRWARKDWDGAAEAYALLTEKRQDVPSRARAATAAGRAYAQAGAVDKARPLLARAAAEPGAVGADAAHSLALLELDAKQPARALEIATRAIAALSAAADQDRDPARLSVLELDRADALWELPERRPEALQAYADIVKNRADQPQAVVAARAMLALALLEAGKPAEALAAAEQFLAERTTAHSDTRVMDVQAIRAEALLGVARYADAAAAYRELIQRHPEAKRRTAWQLRESAALAAGKQWKQVHESIGAALPALRGDAAAEALLLDATALVELGKPAEALVALATLAREHGSWPRTDETLLLGIRARRESGDTAGALASAEEMVKRFPAGPRADVAWYRLGQLRQESGRIDEAIAAYAAARSAKPQGSRAPWALLATGWCHEAKGRLREAIAAWTLLIESHPGAPAAESALLARGDARYRTGDFVGGRADAETFLAGSDAKVAATRGARAGEARMLAGLCLAGEKRHAAAVQAFQQLLAEQPGFAAADRVLLEMGMSQTLDGRPDEAERTFRSLVEKFPASPHAADAWLEIGEARFEARQWDEAVKAYEKAIAAAGGGGGGAALVERARHKIGWAHALRNDHAAAAVAFRTQLAGAAGGPLAADAHAMLGESLFRTGDDAGAAAALGAALAKPEALSSDDVRALALIRAAECAARQGRWEDSLSFAVRLAQTQPDSPSADQARYAGAWAAQNLGRLDDALAAYRTLADRGRTELAARARLMEGEVLFEKGDHKEAIKAFFKVAYGFGEQQAPESLHPWQAQATYEAARCFEVLGKPDQAAKLYAEMVERYPRAQQAPAARKRLEALGTAPSAAEKPAS